MATGSDIVDWDACTLARAIAGRTVSCSETMDAYLAQIDRLNRA